MPGLVEVVQDAAARVIALERPALVYRPEQIRTVIIEVHLTEYGTVTAATCVPVRRAVSPREDLL